MFKRVTIHLTEPICPCTEQRLQWTVHLPPEGPALGIWCDTCGTKVWIPNGRFKAAFELDEPYPNQRETQHVQKDLN